MSGERLSTLAVLPPAAIDHEFEENKWAMNMTLIGDAHWKSLHKVEDTKNVVLRMEKKVNFKVKLLFFIYTMKYEERSINQLFQVYDFSSFIIQLNINSFAIFFYYLEQIVTIPLA